jgi:hypothetical protein
MRSTAMRMHNRAKGPTNPTTKGSHSIKARPPPHQLCSTPTKRVNTHIGRCSNTLG